MDFCVSDSDFQIQETLSCPTQTYSMVKCGSDVRGMLEYNGQTMQIGGFASNLPSPAGYGSIITVKHRSARSNNPGTVSYYSSNDCSGKNFGF